MNIDLLPLAAFALESSRGADRMVAEPRTLTLRLAPFDFSQVSPMSGSAWIEALPPRPEGLLRAAILPVEGHGLTITF